MTVARVRVVHNRKAYAALLKEAGVLADVRARARRVAEAAGDGYVMESDDPHTRARAAVITATGDAVRDNAKNQTLIRSLDAGR